MRTTLPGRAFKTRSQVSKGMSFYEVVGTADQFFRVLHFYAVRTFLHGSAPLAK